VNEKQKNEVKETDGNSIRLDSNHPETGEKPLLNEPNNIGFVKFHETACIIYLYCRFYDSNL